MRFGPNKLETERQGALERPGMALCHQLVAGGTTLLLRALRAKQMTEARRAAHELALGGQLEPLGNGLLGLLHGERSKTEKRPTLGKAFVRDKASPISQSKAFSIDKKDWGGVAWAWVSPLGPAIRSTSRRFPKSLRSMA